MTLVFALADVVYTGVIAGFAAVVAPLLIARQLNRQRQAEKREDYARQNEVAEKAEQARIDLEVANKRRDDEAARQRDEVAKVAREAAALLLEAQAKSTADTDEVARVAADKPAGPAGPEGPTQTKAIVISHPSGLRREITLDGVPSGGQKILLRGDRTPVRVADDGILWVEANGGRLPSVIVVVCPVEDDYVHGAELLEAVDDAHDDM